MTTAVEKKYMGKVAALGCIICRNNGDGETPALIHHCFYGAGKRDNHYLILPLCPTHHQTGGEGVALHANDKAFYGLYGSELKLLNQTIRDLQ